MSDIRAVIPPSTPTFASFQAQQARIVMEGRLNKLKGRGLGKSWVPQHFVLKADAFYYTPNRIFSHKQKKISLVKARIGTAQYYTKKDNAFGIMDARKRALHIMSAESESLMHEWIRALIAVRTALEGRVRDAKPNPTLALNPRFPDIPSLPPPRKDQDEADAADSPSAARAQASATYLAHLTDESDSDGPDAGDDSRSRAPDSMPAAAAASAGLRSTAGRLPTRRAHDSGDNAAPALPPPSLVSSRAARPAAADPLGLAERQDEPGRVRETDADRQTTRDRDRDRPTDRQRQREGRARKKQEPSPARSSVISPARALTATPRHLAEADAAVPTVARGVLLPVHPAPTLASAFSREMVSSAVISFLQHPWCVCMRKVRLWE